MAARPKVSAEDWETIKPTFLRLYNDDSKSLAQVRYELEENHDFKASRSAFTRQIQKWDAFKNYKAIDKQQLALQQRSGQQPKVDTKGRPIKWDRVYRAAKDHKKQAGPRGSVVQRCHSTRHQQSIALASRPPLQPVHNDDRVIGHVVDIWRQSTHHFASKDPSTESYRMEYSLYHQLIQSIAIISMSSEPRWPRQEIDYVCNAIPTLIREQPAMVCEVLILLTKQESMEAFEGLKVLKQHLFNYIRSMSSVVLPKHYPLRRLLSCVDSREDFSRLGVAIVKAKLDTMWNTHIDSTKQIHHRRLFFRQVLINAISVVTDYGEAEYASRFLRKLSDSDSVEAADSTDQRTDRSA